MKCIPCRVTIANQRWRIYSDGSVSASLRYDEVQRLGLNGVKEVLEYESKLARLSPDSMQAKTIRREAARQRRNRNARERDRAMRDLGMKRTSFGWE